MVNAFLAEFMKFRRSKMLIYVILAGCIPSLVKFLQQVLGDNKDTVRWEWFVASNREITVLCTFIALVLASAFIFSMEYQYGTASYIFTASISRIEIFISKLLSLLTLTILLFAVSACSDLLLGFIAFGKGMPPELLLAFMKATGWFICSYFLLSTIVVMVVVLIKKFVLSVVTVMGYLMLIFPFHLKGNPYILPFMTPAAVASKIFGTDNYILANGYYRDITVSFPGMAAFLIVLAAISLLIGIIQFKKQETA